MEATFSLDPFPELYSERIILKRISKEYAQDFLVLRSHPEVMRYIERPRPSSIEDVEAWIDLIDMSISKNESVAWMMIQKDDNKLLGTIGYWRMKKEHFRAEIGYMMFPQYWGKGLMSEAMNLVLDYAFHQMGMHSIEADINPDNEASARILERNGFVKEGLFKESFYWNGKFLDAAIYSLLKSNFINR